MWLFACANKPAENAAQVAAVPIAPVTNIQDSKADDEPQKLIVDNSPYPVIRPLNLIRELRKKKNENPNISVKDLVVYANQLLDKTGFDYTFNWTPKGAENAKNTKLLEQGYNGFLPFYYSFTQSNGAKKRFQLMNDVFSHPCSNVIDIPLKAVSEKTMTVIVGGKKIVLKRSKDFYLESFALVDQSLKKTIRKWATPIDATPAGISEDGKKVYFDSYRFYQNELHNLKESALNVAVEIAEDGKLKFVDAKEIKSIKGEDEYGKKNTESVYTKYKIGNKEFIVNYTPPCT